LRRIEVRLIHPDALPPARTRAGDAGYDLRAVVPFSLAPGERAVVPTGVAIAVPEGAAGRAAIYGIRPEHLMLADDGVPAEVVVVEPTGSEIQVFTKIAGKEVTAIFRERHPFVPGSTIHLKPHADQALIFDKETGKRL